MLLEEVADEDEVLLEAVDEDATELLEDEELTTTSLAPIMLLLVTPAVNAFFM